MKIVNAVFREAVFFDGKLNVQASKTVSLELQPVGVLVSGMAGRKPILVPFSNVKWMDVELDKK